MLVNRVFKIGIKMRDVQKEVLDFWFSAPSALRALADSVEGTEKPSVALGTPVTERFGGGIRLARKGEVDGWADQPDGVLALCILLGPMARVAFWGDAQAYAGDAQGLDVANTALARGYDRLLPVDRREYLYWPFTQSEDGGNQDRAVALWARLQKHDPIGYARVVRGRDTIARFGRFPARDAVLGWREG